MKIALFGYGKMGRIVEEAAARGGDEVVCIVDPVAGGRGELEEAEVCIDFTEPGAVIENVRRAAAAGLPIVVGTTGWLGRMEEARRLVEANKTGLVYGSNFSIGVNLMFRVARYAAALFSRFAEFDPFIEEAHHKFKKDAPSGTALSLREIVEAAYESDVPMASTRAGYIPGTHTLGFDSEADTLIIRHTARNRSGFAAGALAAARWLRGRQGFYEFSEIIDQLHDLGPHS